MAAHCSELFRVAPTITRREPRAKRNPPAALVLPSDYSGCLNAALLKCRNRPPLDHHGWLCAKTT
jgi:hypothetical protein